MQHAHTHSHANRTCGHVHTRITRHKGSHCIHASTYTVCLSKGNRSIAEMRNIDHFTRSARIFDGSLIAVGSICHLGTRPVLGNASYFWSEINYIEIIEMRNINVVSRDKRISVFFFLFLRIFRVFLWHFCFLEKCKRWKFAIVMQNLNYSSLSNNVQMRSLLFLRNNISFLELFEFKILQNIEQCY